MPNQFQGLRPACRLFCHRSSVRALFAQAKLSCPILAVGGERGFGEATLKGVQNISANVRGVIVKDCGHFVNEEKPVELSRLIMDFFAER